MRFNTDHSFNIKNIATGEEINTLYNWHMYPASELNFNPPEPKYAYEEAPASDGSYDATEQTTGRVLYENRKGDWEFYVANRPLDLPNIEDTESWAEIQSSISNFCHGQKCEITLADDPDYYYVGRLKVSAFDPNKHYQHVTISYDVEPFKYSRDEYDSGSLSAYITVTVPGSPMPVIPTIGSYSDERYFKPENALTRGWAINMIYKARCVLLGIPTVTKTKSQFLDVPTDAPYYTALLWAEENNYVSGLTEYIFGGNNVITRAQFVTICWRALGAMERPSGNTSFTDVPQSSYYFYPVKWVSYWNYMSGDGMGHFMPDRPMQRQHGCAVLYKIAGSPTAASVNPIADLPGEVTVEAWYVNAVMKLYLEGIVEGYTDASNRYSFRAGDAVTRAQFVTILWRFAGSPAAEYDLSAITDIGSLSTVQKNALKWAYFYNYVSGTSSTTFSPARQMTRKEAYTIMYNYANEAALHAPGVDLVYIDPTGVDNPISGYELPTDVAQTAYYYWPAVFAIVNGLSTLDNGYRFNPDGLCTRGMVAQMLFKLGGKMNKWSVDTQYSSYHFQDIRRYTVNYTDAVYWCYGNGIVTGRMMTYAPLDVTLTNDRGTFTASVPYGTHPVPELPVCDGENTFSCRDTGTLTIRFRRGSL